MGAAALQARGLGVGGGDISCHSFYFLGSMSPDTRLFLGIAAFPLSMSWAWTQGCCPDSTANCPTPWPQAHGDAVSLAMAEAQLQARAAPHTYLAPALRKRLFLSTAVSILRTRTGVRGRVAPASVSGTHAQPLLGWWGHAFSCGGASPSWPGRPCTHFCGF